MCTCDHAQPTPLACLLTIDACARGRAGDRYERRCITEYLRRSSTDPLTREPLRLDQLYPCHPIRHAAQEFLKKSVARRRGARVRGHPPGPSLLEHPVADDSRLCVLHLLRSYAWSSLPARPGTHGPRSLTTRHDVDRLGMTSPRLQQSTSVPVDVAGAGASCSVRMRARIAIAIACRHPGRARQNVTMHEPKYLDCLRMPTGLLVLWLHPCGYDTCMWHAR